MMFGKKKKLFEAICQDDVAQVKNIASDMRLRGKKVYRDACLLAIENNKSKALEALFAASGCGFDFSSTSSSGDTKTALKLVTAAFGSSDPAPLLWVLWNANEITNCGKLSGSDFLNKDTPVEFVQSILQRKPKSFGDCMKYTGLYSTAENLNLILAYAPKDAAAQSVLDKALVEVAATEDIKKAKVLLERKADPDYNSAQSLLCAAENGHQDMATLLLPHIKDDLNLSDIVLKLQAKKDVPDSIIASIEAEIATRKAAAAASPPPQGDAENGFAALDKNTLCLTQTLPDGSRLTTTFNLLLEQQQAYTKTPDAALSPVATESIKPEALEKLRTILDSLNEKKSPRAHIRLQHRQEIK